MAGCHVAIIEQWNIDYLCCINQTRWHWSHSVILKTCCPVNDWENVLRDCQWVLSRYSSLSPLQVERFVKANGLSDSLLLGCKVVLKERKVVQGLMSKCKTISSKMVKQVTEVMERGTGAMTQPVLLNSPWVKCTRTVTSKVHQVEFSAASMIGWIKTKTLSSPHLDHQSIKESMFLTCTSQTTEMLLFAFIPLFYILSLLFWQDACKREVDLQYRRHWIHWATFCDPSGAAGAVPCKPFPVSVL